jgi:hypothetical protein
MRRTWTKGNEQQCVSANSSSHIEVSQMAPPSAEHQAGDLSVIDQSPEDAASANKVQPDFRTGRSFLLAFTSICIVTLAAALDATSLSITLPTITDRLHGTAIEAFWSGTSFLIASAVVQPVICGFSHAFGRKLV